MMPRDLPAVRAIHDKFYGSEFPLPDFVTNYLCAFVVLDDERIIVAGGVRTLLESVLITDKSYAPEIRKEALLDILAASIYCAKRNNFDGIHAFVIRDEKWASRLERFGFKTPVGKPLVLSI